MYEYGSDPEMDMWMDYDYRMNTVGLNELFPNESYEPAHNEPAEQVEPELSLDDVIRLLKRNLKELEKNNKPQKNTKQSKKKK